MPARCPRCGCGEWDEVCVVVAAVARVEVVSARCRRCGERFTVARGLK